MAQSPMAPPPKSLVFTVTRREPELIAPAEPTPHEFKKLSDIDDQDSLRFQISGMQFYRNGPNSMMKGRDPVKVLREALAQALVYYYPLAGRLREGPGRKLIVECTGEGVIFIEADADVTLEQFGEVLLPPFPCLEELLYDVPGSGGMLDCPLLLIQVTRLKYGGFIFGIRVNHTMTDASGTIQFMNAMAEIARGAHAPSILPVWRRELLNARNPPRVTCTHHEYDGVTDMTNFTIFPLGHDIVSRSFFFGPTEMSALRRFLPPHLQACSSFEVITASVWRCRIIALQLDPAEEVRLLCIVNARAKFSPPLPVGYYGNTFAFPVAPTTAGKLCQNSLGYALELVRKAKNGVTQEYMQSMADAMVIKGRPHFRIARTFVVSDLTRAGFAEVDFGWGKPAYGGTAKGGAETIPGLACFYTPFTNNRGEKGVVVSICLPAPAMERFVKEMDSMLKDHPINATTSTFIKSAI